MATKALSHLPHFKNVFAGMNKWDPVYKAIFEVSFTGLPPALQNMEQINDETNLLLSQQIATISGLDALQKTTAASEQKFYGVTVSYLNPTVDTTSAEITMVFNLNLRNVTDNYVLKVFRAWANLSYDLSTGARGLKADYIADSIRVAEANRNGEIWRCFIFRNVMLTGITGLDDLDYAANDARQLTCTFRADYWEEEIA